MDSIRKWFYKPRRDDKSLLAQFFYADEALNLVAAELDSFDGRKDPERCTTLVNHLRQCQDKVLNICNRIMDELIPDERADRAFRVKFPDDVMQDNLAGQLWFGAECLAAGSSIMNRESESGSMRPLAKALTKSLENVRRLLREASLRTQTPSELAHDRLIESLKMFDRLLAEFELSYVSAMVPVKSVAEYHLQQDVVVLFSETLQRALKVGLLSQDMVDQCDPALMFTIPRLAIVAGLLIYPEGPLCLDASPHLMSEMFRPFRTLLVKVRELLWTLSEAELTTLEKMLCSSDDPAPSRHHSTQSDGEESEEESSCSGWGASECETVLGGDSAPSPEDEEGAQWTLPIIPCACSVQLSEDAPMTKQGLLNRSMPTPDITCDECLDRGNTQADVNIAPGGEGTASTSELTNPQAQSDIINSDYNVNYKQNVSLGDCGLRTMDEWKDRGQSGEASEDLHVRYSENWEALCSSGQLPDDCDKRQNVPVSDSLSSSCSTCHSSFSATSDSSSLTSETSSFNSDCQDEEEVALALRAVQQATKDEARAKFRSSGDLLHRLFVCVSGVADQLQTNFAGDLRHILKSVFLISASDNKIDQEEKLPDIPPESCEEALVWGASNNGNEGLETAPLWLPDEEAPSCMSCHAVFTVIRRRHHCRNCGKVFCARCSSNSVPLPRFGHVKPVRVCNFCFIYQVTPFSVDTIATATATAIAN